MARHPIFSSSVFSSSLLSIIGAAAAALLLSAALSACGPYLSTSMEIPEIPLGDSAAGADARAGLGAVREGDLNPASRSIAVERFVDIRQSPAIVTRGEDSTELIGDVGMKISDTIRRALVEKGYSVSSFGENSVRGQIKTWHADVDSTLNGTLVSEAGLLIEVFNRREQKVFSTVFHGSAKSQTPLISTSDVSDSLGQAMAQAIKQLISDPDFIRAISN